MMILYACSFTYPSLPLRSQQPFHHNNFCISSSVRSPFPLPRQRLSKLRTIVSSSLPPPEEVMSKRITVPNAFGEMLVGVLDDTGSKELVILSHGFCSSKKSSVLVNIACELNGVGLSSFRFDFSGNGESEGDFQYGNYWKEVEDLHSVVVHWTGQGRVINAILGHSKGGSVVLLYASKYRDVFTVMNLSGRCVLEGGMKERLGENFLEKIEEDGFLDVKDECGNVKYRVTKESVKERLNTDMKLAVSLIPKECRVLTVHGSKDEVVPLKEAYEFDKLIPNHTLKIIDGADHVFTNQRKELSALVAEFIIK